MEMIQNFRKRSRVNTDIGKFFTSTEEVRKLIDELKLTVSLIKTKQAEILSVPTAHDTRNQELEELHGKVKTSRITIRAKLKVLEREIQESERLMRETVLEMDGGGGTEAVEGQGQPVRLLQRQSSRYIPVASRIRKTQYFTLSKSFLDAMSDYQTNQVVYRDKLKAQLTRQLEITNSPYSEEDVEKMIDQGNVSVFTKSIIVIETKIARKNLDDIQVRAEEIKKLEKSIKELTELFLEMAQRVESQGALVDNIAKNVDATSDFVAGGRDKFKEAIPLQQSFRKRKAYILTAVVVILTIIILSVIITCASLFT